MAIISVLILSVAILSGTYYFIDPNDFEDYEVFPDGTVIRKVELDGHLYYKTENGRLTHSAACQNKSHPENL